MFYDCIHICSYEIRRLDERSARSTPSVVKESERAIIVGRVVGSDEEDKEFMECDRKHRDLQQKQIPIA